MQGARGSPVVRERGAGKRCHLVRNFVGSYGDNANATQRDDRKRDRVIAREDEECSGNGVDGFGNLGNVAAGLFDADNIWNFGEARQCGGFEVGGGAAGNVVKDDRLVADGFGDGREVTILTFLRWLVVVGGRGEDGVDSGARGDFFGSLDRVVRGVGSGAGDDGNASGGDLDRGVDHVQPFVVGEGWSLAGGATGYEKINTGFDLPGDQVAQGCVVNGTVLMKRSDECGATATELHRNKIARIGDEGNGHVVSIISTAVAT